MARYIGAELSRLIRERAYTSGALKRTKRSITQLNRELLELREKEKEIAVRLAKVDTALGKFASIEPARIRAIAANPHTSNLPRGVFTRELVRYMRDRERPVSTFELEQYLFGVFGISPQAAKEKERLHRKVRKCLRVISAKGAIKRLHDPESRDGKTVGLWLWAGR